VGFLMVCFFRNKIICAILAFFCVSEASALVTDHLIPVEKQYCGYFNDFPPSFNIEDYDVHFEMHLSSWSDELIIQGASNGGEYFIFIHDGYELFSSNNYSGVVPSNSEERLSVFPSDLEAITESKVLITKLLNNASDWSDDARFASINNVTDGTTDLYVSQNNTCGYTFFWEDLGPNMQLLIKNYSSYVDR